jgi:hypothetical protein
MISTLLRETLPGLLHHFKGAINATTRRDWNEEKRTYILKTPPALSHSQRPFRSRDEPALVTQSQNSLRNQRW